MASSQILSRLLIAIFLTSLMACTSSAPIVYSGGSSNGGLQFPYSPKAQDLETGEHIVGVQYGFNPVEYYDADENNHFGQLNYTFAYRLKKFYSNFNLVAGGGQYVFRNANLESDNTHYGYLQGGAEVGLYTEFGDFTWRYIQMRGSVGREFGSYVGKMFRGQSELDERYPDDDINFLYYGPGMVSFSLSTELELHMDRTTKLGIQLGSYQENLSYRLGSVVFFEYKQVGLYLSNYYDPQSTYYNVGMYYRL